MFSFLRNFYPEPILVDLGIFEIYWYGLLIGAAVFFCLWLALKLAKRVQLSSDHVFNLVFYLVIFGLLGARLWHVLFYNFFYFLANPLDIVKVWQGGLAIQGGILAGLITLIVYCRRQQLSLWKYADIIAVVLPLGQAIGRWGNYFNQELFGRPCDYFWCIPINPANRPDQYVNFTHFQPVFLYESILNLALFIILLFIWSRKVQSGLVVLMYLGGYSVIRFITEFWRMDSTIGWFGLTLVQWLCLLIILFVVYFFLNNLFKRKAAGH